MQVKDDHKYIRLSANLIRQFNKPAPAFDTQHDSWLWCDFSSEAQGIIYPKIRKTIRSWREKVPALVDNENPRR